MSTFKYILSLVFLGIMATTQAATEDSIIVKRNVTVEREYKPVIQSAGKINDNPKVQELKTEKISPKFSDFNYPLNANYNIHTLPSAELQRQKPAKTSDGFARLGLGNYFNTLADFAYPLIKNSTTNLDFSLNHLGTFGSKMHSTTNANLSFNTYIKDIDVYAGIGGGHEALKYYGNFFNKTNTVVSIDSLKKLDGNTSYTEQNTNPAGSISLGNLINQSPNNTFWRFNILGGVRSMALSEDTRFNAEMQYRLFNSASGFAENRVRTVAGIELPHNENRMGINLEMNNLGYTATLPADSAFNDKYSQLELNPFYSIERPTYSLRLGLKASIKFSDQPQFKPSADVHAEWRAIPEHFSLFGGITGGDQINTMDGMFKENCYLYPNIVVKNTYTPSEVYAGFKLKPLYNLLLDGYIDFHDISSQYFFVNKEYKSDIVNGDNSTLMTNRFNVIYSNATLLKIGARAGYNYKNIVNVQLKGTYNGWNVENEQYAWNQPKWESDLTTDIRFNPDFSASASIFHQGERYAKLGTTAMRMRPKTDINLGISYLYNEWITTFFKVNNLLNSRYQNLYGYDVQGFNVLLGAVISF